MPPTKTRPAIPQDDARSESSVARDRSTNAFGGVRKVKPTASSVFTNGANRENGSGLKELVMASTDGGDVIASGQSSGMQWSTVSTRVLDSYRLAYAVPSPAAFSSNYSRAVLTQPGIGRQSPTMARRKDHRRVSKEHLATAVRKHFNGAAVSELDVVVELAYRAKNNDKAFRLRSGPLIMRR